MSFAVSVVQICEVVRMTCKDCISYNVCEWGQLYETPCVKFKNKTDFVEVVRCKDCDISHNRWTGCPKMGGLIPPPDHFCSYGRRK